MAPAPAGEPILIVGAGAIGATVGAWIASFHDEVSFVARGATADAIRENGLRVYPGSQRDRYVAFRPPVYTADDQWPRAAVVIVTVKNYSLDDVCRRIVDKLGNEAIVVGLQNGVVNQRILPEYFRRSIFGIVGYNAWVDAPGVVGYQRQGPIYFGAIDPAMRSECRELADYFARGFDAYFTDRVQDAAYNKIVLNLTNSLTALVGFGYRPIDDPATAQRLLSAVLDEGIDVLRAAGVRQVRMKSLPSWGLLRASARLPQWLTGPIFRRQLKKMNISSMAQDVIGHHRPDTELETINGELLALADRHGIDAPINRALFDLCREKFAQTDFQPMTVSHVSRRLGLTAS
ncbi:ketopantoate reductase family protein [bacterium]|nr:ketopantoate reductase family protein [bacterium]